MKLGTKRTLPIMVLIVLSLAAAGCGGRRSAPPAPTETEGRRIEMDSGEFFFRPADLTVKRGETVTIAVKNSGSVEHNISIDEFNVDRDYNPGETATVTFTADKVGTFRLYCDIVGHSEAGMVGTLTVEE